MGPRTADGRRLIVHHGHKVVNAAAAHIVRHDVGGLVGTGQQHGVEQIAQRLGISPADVRRGSIGGFLPDQIVDVAGCRHRDGVQLVLVLFQHQQTGHHLGQAGRLQLGIAVFVVDHDVGVQVDHIRRRRRQFRCISRQCAALPFCRHRQHQHEG